MNGFTAVGLGVLLLSVVVMAVEYRYDGSITVGIVIGALSLVIVVASMVQATRDEDRERTSWIWSEAERAEAAKLRGDRPGH